MIGHVLIARPDNDGDVLLAGPAVRAAAAHARRVTLLVGPRGRQAAGLLPGADGILVERLPWIDPDRHPVDRGRMLALVDRVAALAPDAGVILSSFHQSPLPLALLLRMAGVPRLAATSVDFPGSLLDVRHAIDDDVHEVERSLDLMSAAGMPARPGDDRLEVVTAPGDDAVAAGLPEGYVVVHPGASVPARAWAPAHHARLVGELARHGLPVVVTGGPGERELTAAVAGQPRDGVVDLGGRTSLGELAEVLRRARLVVVGNTGPAHLAAAVGCPVVWLHAPTVPAVRWHPWRVPYLRIGLPVPCAGCRARVCPVPGHPCLDDVPAEQVAAAARSLLRERAAQGAVA